MLIGEWLNGRVAVSKTVGCVFESRLPCQISITSVVGIFYFVFYIITQPTPSVADCLVKPIQIRSTKYNYTIIFVFLLVILLKIKTIVLKSTINLQTYLYTNKKPPDTGGFLFVLTYNYLLYSLQSKWSGASSSMISGKRPALS